MLSRSELPSTLSQEKAFLQPKELSPIELDQQIEAQRSFFLECVANFSSKLEGKELTDELPTLLAELQKNVNSEPITSATEFMALVSAVEGKRSRRHSVNWEQAAAALHIVFPYEKREIQRILMATGEGKTFTIAMAALWKAHLGETVTIHTDKQANVEQSHRATAELYALFGVESAQALSAEQAGPEYMNYLNGEMPAVRYGVWSQFMHESLVRQSIVYEAKALLRGDLASQREGKVRLASPDGINKLIAHHEKYLIPDTVIGDEGDVSVDLEASPVVLSQESGETLSESDVAELQLAWELFDNQDPAALQRIAEATGFPLEKIQEKYAIAPIERVEGDDLEEDVLAVTANRVVVATEYVFFAKMFEMSATPAQLTEVLDLAIAQHASSLPTETLRKLREAALSAQEGQLNWQKVAEALPVPTRSELRTFLSDQNPILSYSKVVETHPELKRVMRGDGTLSEVDNDVLKSVFGSELPLFQQRLTFFRVLAFVQQVCEPLFIHYNHDVTNVRYMLEEGNDYQIEQYEDGAEIVVLSEDRQPQPGKQFEDNVQAFIQLKHGLPISVGQQTVGQIMPVTWYYSRSRQGSEVTSISGTQENPNYVVELTGTSRVEELPPRVFEHREQKLRAIVKYVQDRGDAPILLCAQDYSEWKALADALENTPDRELIKLDADHAEDSYELVPQLSKGKILLLQITSRGLDFGRLNEEMKHSFENGVIIGSGPLKDSHQEDQRRGRLGNKRPEGEVVLFTSLDDEVAQQFYLISPKTREQRAKEFSQLEVRYQQLVASPALSRLEWPTSFAEAMAEVDMWLEKDETVSLPTWVQIIVGDQAISAEMRPHMESLTSKWKALIRRYEALREGHSSTIDRQQQNNMRRAFESRREQMTIDVVVQNIWQRVMSPTESTPLEAAVRPLRHEQRKQLMVRIFDEAEMIYTTSKLKVKPDQQESATHNEERKMNQFMRDFTEQIIDWITIDNLHDEYRALSEAWSLSEFKHTPLPEQLSQLAEWLDRNFPKQQKNRLQRLTQQLFVGLQLFSQPDQIPTLSRDEQEDELIAQLRDLAQQEQQISRKVQAEK